MKVAVLGGGVVGVATAYFLAEDGHEVTLIERRDRAAQETSRGNAGLVAPSDSYAWASPDALKTAVKSLWSPDMGIQYKLRLDPRLWLWSLRFFFQCTPAATHRNTLRKLRISSYSQQMLNQVLAATGIEHHGRRGGVLYFFRSRASLTAGARHMRILQDHGLELETLDRDQILALDPGLKATGDIIAGGLYSPRCQTGDSHRFSVELARWCAENRGVDLRWNTVIERIEADGDRITGVVTDKGTVTADAYVLAAGAESALLGEQIGLKLPIYPVKGYSITAPIRDPEAAPKIGLVDEDRLVAMSRLGDRLRVASSAIFTGYDTSTPPEGFDIVLRTARELFPAGADYEKAERWAGLRPMTPSSVPILGRARYRNFFLNVGHGHVGWTMSCGTAKFVTDCLAGRPTEIDGEGLLYG